MRKALVFVAALGTCTYAVYLGATSPAMVSCTPAQSAQLSDISRIVLRDYIAGDSYEVIAQDVQNALIALDASVLEIDIAAVIEDAILLLVDTHQLPPSVITNVIQAGDGGLPSVLATAHARRRTPLTAPAARP